LSSQVLATYLVTSLVNDLCDPNPETVGQACGSAEVCQTNGTGQCPSETTAVTVSFAPTGNDLFCLIVAHLRAVTPNTGLVAVATEKTVIGGPDHHSLSLTTVACGNVDSQLYGIRNVGQSAKIDVCARRTESRSLDRLSCIVMNAGSQ